MPRPRRQAPAYDEKKVVQLLRRQDGVVARRQLIALGVTPADIRRQLRRRVIHRLSAGVYAETARPDLLQTVWWACLHFGRAAAADLTALQLARDGSGKHLTAPLHVAIAHARNVGPLPGVEVHQVRRLETVIGWNASPPRMRSAHAALRHASRATSDNDVVSRLADAVNWRVTKAKRMVEALVDLPALTQRRFIGEVLRDLAAGACSVLEREYLVRVERAHGLPDGSRQAPRRTPGGFEFRDVDYDPLPLVVELQGRAFHSGKQAWDADLERALDDLVAAKETVGLGWQQVLGTPCATAAKVAVLLQQRGWGGRARPCGPGCPVGS